jgi:vancomycin resistance protein YoaR
MSYRTTTREKVAIPLPGPLPQALLALIGGVALFVILLGGFAISFNSFYADHVYPGVSVYGVDLSGLTIDEAEATLSQQINYTEQGRILFRGDQTWVAKPSEVGLFFDAKTTAMAAHSVGRQGNLYTRLSEQFRAWYTGIELSPLLIYDARVAQRYISQIAAQVDTPTVEASLSINGTEVVALPGQIGRSVNIEASLAPLEEHLRNLEDGEIPIIITEKPPDILDASAQAAEAERLLSTPLTLVVPDSEEGDPGPWTFDQETLAEMITIKRTQTSAETQFQVGLDAQSLSTFLTDIAGDMERTPAEPRFIFNDDTRQLEVIQPAVIGRALDVDGTIMAINQNLVQGDHNISLVFDYTHPLVSDDTTAQELGITEAVSVESSYFYGSSAARIQNIQTAASRFHGILIPPGETFSMADILGDVSLDNGYAEALIIFGNRTIKGVGGGVCQVSTTLFRTVFFGGFPIIERHSHAYRVSYYEQTASGNVNPKLAGLDATVYVPVVDFQFVNDTPNWLLMETYVNAPARRLTWKFYSTSDGRAVEWDTTGLKNIVEPPKPLYQENPDLKKGVIEQVDWEAEGADVTVYRTVNRNGEVYFEDDFSTHYMPWRAVYEYGPGTKIPKNKKN